MDVDLPIINGTYLEIKLENLSETWEYKSLSTVINVHVWQSGDNPPPPLCLQQSVSATRPDWARFLAAGECEWGNTGAPSSGRSATKVSHCWDPAWYSVTEGGGGARTPRRSVPVSDQLKKKSAKIAWVSPLNQTEKLTFITQMSGLSILNMS